MEELIQNHPNSRENPPRKDNIIFTWQRLGTGQMTFLYLCAGFTLFFGFVISYMIYGFLGFGDGENVPASEFLNPQFLIILTLVSLAVFFIWRTLSKNFNLPIKEQKKYYELGNVKPLTEEQSKALHLHLADMFYGGFWQKTLEYYPCEVRLNQHQFIPKTFFIAGKEEYKKSLDEDWGIVSASQYHQMVKDLFGGMHSKLFASDIDYTLNSELYFIPQNEEEKLNLEKSNNNFLNHLAGLIEKPVSFVLDAYKEKNGEPKQLIWGFDLWRVVPMARNAFMAGYITEDEAWKDIIKASDLAHYLFNSYEEFYDNYRLGIAYWSNKLETTSKKSKIWRIFAEQCNWEDKNRPWTSDKTPIISQEMRNGFEHFVKSKRLDNGERIGFRK